MPLVTSAADKPPGQIIAAQIFAVDGSGNPLFSTRDKEMFIELIELFNDVDDANGMAAAYQAGFNALDAGQQDRLASFGCTVDIANAFATYLDGELDKTTFLNNLRSYLLNNDADSFAAALDRRQNDFLAIINNNTNIIEKGIRNMPRLFKYLRMSGVWHTEVFDYNTLTKVMSLNAANAKKAIDIANEELQNDIENYETVLDAMDEMPKYYNAASTQDQTAMYAYLYKYGFLRLVTPDNSTPTITPTPTPTTSPAPPFSNTTPTPTPAVVVIEDELIPLGPGSYYVIKEVEGDTVHGEFTQEDWNEISGTYKLPFIILSAKTGMSTSNIYSITIEMSVLREMEAASIQRLILETDITNLEFVPSALIDAVEAGSPGNEDSIFSVTLTFRKMTDKEAYPNGMTAEQQSAWIEGSPVYDITMTYLEKYPTTSYVKQIRSDVIFSSPAILSIPYAAPAGTDMDSIILMYQNADGTLENIGGIYDTEKQTLYSMLKHMSQYIIGEKDKEYPDLTDSYWAYHELKNFSANEIMIGMPDNTMAPEGDVTRAEFAKMAVLTLRYRFNPDYEISFNDVNEQDWFYEYACMAVENGTMFGYPGNMFMPNNKITRQEMVTIVARALKNRAPEASFENLPFEDKEEIANYAKSSVAIVYEAGIIDWMDDETFDPTAYTTRAEAAAMLYRLCKILMYMN